MDIILSSASHHAMLFAYLAKRTIETFGDAGREAVTAGVIRYGEQRGLRMALRTQADGNPLDVENYLAYGEWEAFPGQMDLRFPTYTPEVRMENHRCPWHTEWSKRGLLEYGQYYCKDVDAALARGYNGMELKLFANRTLGDDCCDFTFCGCGIPEERMEAFAENAGGSGIRPKCRGNTTSATCIPPCMKPLQPRSAQRAKPWPRWHWTITKKNTARKHGRWCSNTPGSIMTQCPLMRASEAEVAVCNMNSNA